MIKLKMHLDSPDELKLAAEFLADLAGLREEPEWVPDAAMTAGLEATGELIVEGLKNAIEQAKAGAGEPAAVAGEPSPPVTPAAKRTRRTKAEIEAAKLAKDAPQGVQTIRTSGDAVAAAARGDIILFNSGGEQRAAFAESAAATEVLVKVVIGQAPNLDALKAVLEANKPALEKLTPEDLEAVTAAYDAKLGEFAAPATDDLPDFMQEVAATPAAATTPAAAAAPAATPAASATTDLMGRVSEFGRQKGFTALTALFKKYEAKKFGDIAVARHAELSAEVEAALAVAA